MSGVGDTVCDTKPRRNNEMPTSSITKSFVIKDEEALRRFKAEMEKQTTPPTTVDKNKLDEGKKALARHLARK